MDNIISEARSINDNTFLNHIFSTSEESKAEILNVVQYAVMGVLPVVGLNKTIQKFIPEADVEKSSLEVLAEIFIQIVVMFVGVVLIHRLITYFPTYSGYKYEAFNLTTVILAFLVIVLSLQTKLGIKVNILVDRVLELWNGPSKEVVKKDSKRPVNNHAASQADTLDNSGVQNGIFPPPPAVTTSNRSSGQGHDYMLKASGQGAAMSDFSDFGPMPANSALSGGSFW
uniref:Uncharacterized protein n=1 Tax=viral metagenome TaxID=1070528 RepID=A0A6C0B516_9ZZZZ